MCAALDAALETNMDPETCLNELEECLKVDLDHVYETLGIIRERCEAYEGWRKHGGYASTKDQINLDFRYHTLRTRVYQMMARLRKHYESVVLSPGRFQGEAPWTPYLWDCCMAGEGEESEDGSEIKYTVQECDRLLWPELVVGATFWLHQQDDGFIVERHAYLGE